MNHVIDRKSGPHARGGAARADAPSRIVLAVRSSILLKQTAFTVLVVVLAGGTLILAGHTFVRSMVRDQIDQRLILVASDRQVLTQSYILQQLERVALVASRTRLRQLVREHIVAAIDGEEFRRESRRILVDALKSSSAFLRITIVDLNGTPITATDDGALGTDYSANPDVQAGRRGGHLGLPYKVDGTYRALLTAPLAADSGAPLAVVVVLLDLAPLTGLVADRVGLGETGEVLLGTRQDDEVRLLAPLRHAPAAAALPLETMPVMDRALRGETGLVHTRDYRGAEVLAAYLPVGYQEWGMVAKIDISEAYAPLARLRALLVGLEAGLLVIGSVASYLMARRSVQPILALADAAAEVAAGDLQARVPATANDEVGILARAFGRMTERLAASHATLERRVAERTAQLEAANKELESFSYSVAHDLRAPLRAMDGFSKLVAEDFAPQLPPDAQRYLQLVRDNAQQMGRLIDDLLAFSRLGRQLLHREPVQTVGLVQQVIQDLQREEEGRRVTITVGDLPDCHADPGLLRQVFVNLISNALKFTRRRDEAQIDVRSRAGSDGTVYYVQDNGTGFDMRYAGKLFGVFQRLHRAEEYEGTGVGLAIVQRIVHRHGGRVWAEAAVDKGATFFFTLGGTTDGGDAGRDPSG